MPKNPMTSVGKYLYTLRMRRGYTNISLYLRDFPELAITEAYYRELEAGRKRLSVETAEGVASVLHADRKEFYYHLLKDLLPPDVLSDLVRPVAMHTFENLEDMQRVLEHDRQVFEEAFAKAVVRESFVPSAEAVSTLVKRQDLLAIIHFIYSSEHVSDVEIGEVLKRNKIKDSIRDVIELFAGLDLVSVETYGQKALIRRKAPRFRLPQTTDGIKLKNAFVIDEVKTALAHQESTIPPAEASAYVHTGIFATSSDSLDRIKGRAVALLAEIEAAEEPLSRGRSEPMFIGLFVSSRPEYYAGHRNHEQPQKIPKKEKRK